MPLLTNLEKRSLEKGAKEARKQDIIKLLQNRFVNIPESLIKTINQIDDMSLLETLLLPSVTVNSLAEFEQLIKSNQSQQE
jgi:hypothetical protein